MYRDGLDAHLVTRAVDSERDLAAVRDQQLLDWHQPMITSGWSNSTGWASATMIFLIVPPSGAVIGFITFIASTMHRVSPALTGLPTSMNGAAPGSGDMKAVPTIGDLMVVPLTSSTAAGSAPMSSLPCIGGAVSAGAADTGAAAIIACISRLTLMRRSPS